MKILASMMMAISISENVSWDHAMNTQTGDPGVNVPKHAVSAKELVSDSVSQLREIMAI